MIFLRYFSILYLFLHFYLVYRMNGYFLVNCFRSVNSLRYGGLGKGLVTDARITIVVFNVPRRDLFYVMNIIIITAGHNAFPKTRH